MFRELRWTENLFAGTLEQALTQQRLDTDATPWYHGAPLDGGHMAAHRITNAQLGVFLWWMELDREATIALVTGGGREKAYALLHDSGSLMHDERGPIVAASWPEICEHARVNSAVWVLVFHDRRVVRIAFGKNAAYVDSNAVLVVASKDALAALTNTDTQEKQDEEAADIVNKARRKRAR